MALTAILALLQSIPSILQLAETIKGDLGTTDLATLNAAIATAKAAALADVAQAEADLKAAEAK